MNTNILTGAVAIQVNSNTIIANENILINQRIQNPNFVEEKISFKSIVKTLKTIVATL